MDKTGDDWAGLHLGKFEKRRPTFFLKFMSVYIKTSFAQLLLVTLLCDSCYVTLILTLALPIWRLELIIDKIKQNCLK